MSRRPSLALGFALVLMGCSDSTTLPHYDSSINGKSVSYQVNQAFILELDVLASAGYQWDHIISDTTVVRLDSTTFRPKRRGPILPGALTVATFHWRTLKAGSATITLSEHRSWLPDEPPVATVWFTVSVLP